MQGLVGDEGRVVEHRVSHSDTFNNTVRINYNRPPISCVHEEEVINQYKIATIIATPIPILAELKNISQQDIMPYFTRLRGDMR